MKYQGLAILFGAAATASAKHLGEHHGHSQCPKGYTASVYTSYSTIYLDSTSPTATQAVAAAELTTTPSPMVVVEASTLTSTDDAYGSAPTSSAAWDSAVTSSAAGIKAVSTSTEDAPEPTVAVVAEMSTENVVVPAATSSASSSTSAAQVAAINTSPASSLTTAPASAASTTSASSASSSSSSSSSAPSSSDSNSASSSPAANAHQVTSAGSSSGKATFYGGNLSGGTCSFTGYTLPQGMFGTAFSGAEWNNAAECGACVAVTGPNGKTIKAMIVDKCPECEAGHFDLFQNAFAELSALSAGIIPISWEYTSCDLSGPLSLKNKVGTSKYWFSMQVVNANEPVTKLEVSTDGGNSWKSTTRTDYNYFEQSSGFGADSFDVRVTGQSGTTVVVKNVGPTAESVYKASANL
ncbi:Expansin [Penicillium ucsense]|uniref:Expansin n=1 Tax=Penicillium ucsense TaxID=2839758 RepID=A0A8J8WHF2_9EURO|nr:Expansin [Penicillium ucsense]KAF7738659.1 Expansin [Penicillium ucsense]